MSRRRIGRAAALGVVLAILCPVGAAAQAREFVAGEVLVRFKPGATATARSRARAELGANVEDSLPVRGLQLLELPPGAPVEAAASELEGDPNVLYAEPNRYRRLRALPNDPLLPRLWGLDNAGQAFPVLAGQASGTPDADIDAPEAWDVTTGSPLVTVAIGDSGVAGDHPDLAPNMDPRGVDFVDGDGDPADPVGHGTRVAGVIGARGNDGGGITGVNWNVRLLALRIGGDAGLTSAAAVQSFALAAARGARVYNGSFGDSVATRAEIDAIDAAAGVLFVFAADNGGASSDLVGDYPCAYPSPNILCVTASDPYDRLAPFSNYGRTSVDLAAPGESVWSTIPGGGHLVSDGTSFATPHVSGVAALYLARYPGATVADLRRAILGGVDVKPAFASLSSGGRLNARGTLAIPSEAAAPAPVSATSTPASDPTPARSAETVANPARALWVARRRAWRALARSGLRARVSCPAACTVAARLELDRRAARRLGLPRVIGRGSARLTAAGTTALAIRLVRAVAARRRPRVGVRARLVVTRKLRSGERTRLVRTLVLER